MNEPYITLAGRSDAELTEKKSRFLSFAAPVGSEAEAIAFISEIRSAYPDARHCVYAYRIYSDPPYRARYSDDGDPREMRRSRLRGYRTEYRRLLCRSSYI